MCIRDSCYCGQHVQGSDIDHAMTCPKLSGSRSRRHMHQPIDLPYGKDWHAADRLVGAYNLQNDSRLWALETIHAEHTMLQNMGADHTLVTTPCTLYMIATREY